MYLHRVPDYTESGDIPSDFVENRTLHVNNNDQEPVEPHKNLTSTYQEYAEASGVTFVFPGDYPDDVDVGTEIINPATDITLDYLQIYRKAQLALVASTNGDDFKNLVNLTTEAMEGDRSGNLHIGYNQTLYIGTGQLPTDVSLYHGSTTTLQGELRAAGVTVTIEGVVASVENITIVDGGKIFLYPFTYSINCCCDFMSFFFLFQNIRTNAVLKRHALYISRFVETGLYLRFISKVTYIIHSCTVTEHRRTMYIDLTK